MLLQFERFYETKFTGRKLSWLYHMSLGKFSCDKPWHTCIAKGNVVGYVCLSELTHSATMRSGEQEGLLMGV